MFLVLAICGRQFLFLTTARLVHLLKSLHHYAASIPAHSLEKSTATRILRAASGLSAILFFFLVPSPAHAQMSAPLEDRTKAHFLAQFPNFIEWPDTAFSSPQSPFLFCIFGDFSYGPYLAQTVRGIAIHGRSVEVRSVHPEQNLRACQVLFISRSKQKQYGKVMEVVQGSSVLTIGETTDFLDAGGALSLSFDLETLHFDVNLVAANNAHLRISSRMLALAHRVFNIQEAARS